MPELGETWSVMECDGDSGRLEAVVIATGPTMVRLVTRSGRRVTFPVRRWDTTWTLVAGPPTEPHHCCGCQQTAFFRHTVGGETVWVCEDHVPHGARAYFPGDTPGPATLEMACPRCDSTLVQVKPGVIMLSATRTTTQWECEHCRCAWSPLVGQGLADDGSVLAADIAQTMRAVLPVTEVWLGFVAYRTLCRAMGMGDVGHMQGVPLLCKASLQATLTVVFYKASTAAREEEVRSPPFGHDFPSRTVEIGSLWRRRTTGWHGELCRVVAPHNARNVTCRLLTPDDDPRPAITLPLATFHLYWTPHVALTECPRPWTIWRHIESDQLVQVIPGTATHSANSQVTYVTRHGNHETTPVVTFHRLHRELPAPPDGHIWHRSGYLYLAETRDGYATALPHQLHEASRAVPAQSFDIAEFFDSHEPLVFEDEIVSYDPEAVIQRDARWERKGDPFDAAFIVDIGRAGDTNDFVRFNNDAGHHVMELQQFLTKFELPPCSVPCEPEETWLNLENPKQEIIIDRVDAPRRKVFIRSESRVTSVSFAELMAQYRKLDVRSYWEILDSEDDS